MSADHVLQKKKSKNDVVCDLHVGKKNPKKKRGASLRSPLFFKKVFFETF